VLKVYGSDKKQVKALEDFVDGERYICTGAERLDEAGSKFTTLPKRKIPKKELPFI
jgi:hypothetical protein